MYSVHTQVWDRECATRKLFWCKFISSCSCSDIFDFCSDLLKAFEIDIT